MELAIEDIALQDTLRIGEREQDEVERELRESVEKSLTEIQWQQQLNDQVTGTETESQLQKDREKEGQEIKTRLQQRWREQKQKTAETEQTEEGAEGGDRQHPPTQITKSQKRLRPDKRQEVQPEIDCAENYRTWIPIT